jgi:hypothetical protein
LARWFHALRLHEKWAAVLARRLAELVAGGGDADAIRRMVETAFVEALG